MNECCCGMCVYASAAAASGISPDGMLDGMSEGMRCLLFCFGASCEVVPCQRLLVLMVTRLEVAKKYGISESMTHACCCTCWCPWCSNMQVQQEIMMREELEYGCAKVVHKSAAPAAVQSTPVVTALVQGPTPVVPLVATSVPAVDGTVVQQKMG